MFEEKYSGLYDDIMKNISDLPDISDIERQQGIAVKHRKPNIFIRILKYLIPWKGDKPAEIVRKIIFFISLVVFIITLFIVISYYIEPFVNAKLTDEIRRKYTTTEGYSSDVMNPKFADLYAQNNDIAGWITISGTNINYPVVHTEKMKGSNDYYLRTGFDNKYSRFGTIYAERTNNLGYMSESKNITLYGHNMKDDSTMFGQLLNYSKLDYYKKHPLITFDTLYRDGKWKIFAVLVTNSTPYENNGYVFDYRKTDFSSDEQFLYWVNEVKKRSIINTTVQVDKDDEILTLQTCTYEFNNARYVVLARRVRTGETLSVNVDDAVLNPDPVYPQAWYDYLGEKNPHPNEQPNLVAVEYEEADIKVVSKTYAKKTSRTYPSVSRPVATQAQTTKKKSPTKTTTQTTTIATETVATDKMPEDITEPILSESPPEETVATEKTKVPTEQVGE